MKTLNTKELLRQAQINGIKVRRVTDRQLEALHKLGIEVDFNIVTPARSKYAYYTYNRIVNPDKVSCKHESIFECEHKLSSACPRTYVAIK